MKKQQEKVGERSARKSRIKSLLLLSWYHASVLGCPICLDKIRHVLECSLNRMPKLMPPVAEKKKKGKEIKLQWKARTK
jgi:hypothetical protein